MKKYRDISNLRFGLGYLPALTVGSGIFFYGGYCDNLWVAVGGLISLVGLILATTYVWGKILLINEKIER